METNMPSSGAPESDSDEHKNRHLTVASIATVALILAVIALLLRSCDLGSETSERRLRECLDLVGQLQSGAAGADDEFGSIGFGETDGTDGSVPIDGADGIDGVDGLDGVDGADGADGEKGDTGPTGPAGGKGDTGATGSAGDKGDTGATGSAGDKGDTGATGEKGEPGLQGAAGECGLSAYDVWLALGNVGSEQDFIDSLTGPQGPQGEPGSVGTSGLGDSASFWDVATQSAPAINTPTPMLLRQTDTANNVGVSISDNSKFTFTNPGVYNLAFSAQYSRSQGGTVNFVSIWLRKNGVNVPDTATDITLQSNGTRYVAAWNFFIPVTCTASGCDQYELMWSTDTTFTSLVYVPVNGEVRPGIPSLIATVNQVR